MRSVRAARIAASRRNAHRLEPTLGKSEYLAIGGPLFMGAVSVPLFEDFSLNQDIVLAVCGGLGFQ